MTMRAMVVVAVVIVIAVIVIVVIVVVVGHSETGDDVTKSTGPGNVPAGDHPSSGGWKTIQ